MGQYYTIQMKKPQNKKWKTYDTTTINKRNLPKTKPMVLSGSPEYDYFHYSDAEYMFNQFSVFRFVCEQMPNEVVVNFSRDGKKSDNTVVVKIAPGRVNKNKKQYCYAVQEDEKTFSVVLPAPYQTGHTIYCPASSYEHVEIAVPKMAKAVGSLQTEDSNGIKLMEFSYMRNPFMEALSMELWKIPQIVVTLGDYAETTDFPEDMQDILEKRKSHQFYTVDDSDYEDMISHAYLINMTKNIYVDMSKYSSHIHPLSLLTAVGNGRGGGDYYGSCRSHVGTWAGDVIVFDDHVPEGFQQLSIVFQED